MEKKKIFIGSSCHIRKRKYCFANLHQHLISKYSAIEEQERPHEDCKCTTKCGGGLRGCRGRHLVTIGVALVIQKVCHGFEQMSLLVSGPYAMILIHIDLQKKSHYFMFISYLCVCDPIN
jgi:hypothetical protein